MFQYAEKTVEQIFVILILKFLANLLNSKFGLLSLQQLKLNLAVEKLLV